MSTTNHAHTIHGRPVVNARQKLKLHISAADVRAGKAKNAKGCAAALAAVREVPNCVAARVHLGRVYLLQKGATRGQDKWLRFRTPDSLRNEIIAFDRGGRFEPGEYELKPMSPADLQPRTVNVVRPGREGPTTTIGKQPRRFTVAKGVRRRMNEISTD